MKIYIETPFNKHIKDRLSTALDKDELFFSEAETDAEIRHRHFKDSEIFFGNAKQKEWLEEENKLQWIQFHSAGVDYFRGINTSAVTTNMQDFYSEPCAETMIAGILALYRHTDHFTLLKKSNTWVGHKVRPQLGLLQHKKVILLGAGAIAQRIARLLSGFDCEIKYYARSAEIATIKNADDLTRAIPWADIIIGTLPGTSETQGLFTNEMIDNMQSTAIFCNVGRGNLLKDEMHLVDALMQHRIKGAVLDVTAAEPLPAEHPLWNCPNTILSQHSGGGSSEEFTGIVDLFLENLALYKAGKPLKNVVSLNRGY